MTHITMKPLLAILLLPILTSAHVAWHPTVQVTPSTTITATSSPTQLLPLNSIPTITSPPAQTQSSNPIISGVSHLLDEIDEHLHIDLRKRQGGVGATNAVPATTAVIQMPAITTYDMKGEIPPVVYTQLFTLPVNPWPSVVAGTIGLGTIQGQIGVVKTNHKRDTEPTKTAMAVQTLRIKGRGVSFK